MRTLLGSVSACPPPLGVGGELGVGVGELFGGPALSATFLSEDTELAGLVFVRLPSAALASISRIGGRASLLGCGSGQVTAAFSGATGKDRRSPASRSPRCG